MLKNILKLGWPQMTLWRMRIACSNPKATNTHQQYAIVIDFSQQQWLNQRASMLRYAYFPCIVFAEVQQSSCT
jgi:hypothetical protein